MASGVQMDLHGPMLHSLSLRGFRGISSLSLQFDELTVLLGENGCGKSTILLALDRCLGPGSSPGHLGFLQSDFSTSSGAPGEITIEVSLVEPADRRWSAALIEEFGPAIHLNPRNVRQIRLSVCARRLDTGRVIEASHCLLDARNREVPGSRRPGSLDSLRRFFPVLLLGRNQKRLAGAFRDLLPRGGAEMQPGSPSRLMALGLERAASWAQQWDSLTPEQLRAGGAAAQQLWQSALAEFHARRGRRAARFAPLFPGSGVQRLVPLLWLRAVLEARGPGALHPDSRPIMVLDHIEADLHPNLLRAMWYAVQSSPCQKIVTTYSADLLADVPLESLRRLVRHQSVRVYGLQPRSLSATDRRKLGYHIRARRGSLLFSRCWLLVEGESEFWLLPELARLCGFDLYAEGISCVEYAQCGPRPLIQLANALGIPWHLLADGDRAGQSYVRTARNLVPGELADRSITRLSQPNLEQLLWDEGYAAVFRKAAGADLGPRATIAQAVELVSKPGLVLAVISAASQPGSPGVPPLLRQTISEAVRQARAGVVA